MSYIKQINDDFESLNQILIENFGDPNISDDILNQFELFHRNLLIFKDLFNDISGMIPENASRAFELTIVDFLDFIWLSYLGRYKSAMAALRTGLDVFARGATRILPEIDESDSFSQNIQLTMKTIRIKNEQIMEFSRTRKIHKRFIENSYTSPLIVFYGELSDLIHGKETIVISLPDYIIDVLDVHKNYDEEVLRKVIILAKEVMSLILQVFIILNFASLNINSNLYKLEIVFALQDDRLKKYKSDFLIYSKI